MLCGAFGLCASLPDTASAGDFVPSLSLQTGVTATRSPIQGGNTDDFFVAATPQLMYFVEGERTVAVLSYSFTGSLNTVLPNGIANRLAAATVHDIDPRTRLLFGVDALQALIGNYLLVNRAAQSRLGGVTNLNTSLLTIGVSQGLQHELSPVVRFTEGVTGTYVTALDSTQLNNYLGTATFNLDRAYEFDAIGAELGFQYARASQAPLPDTQIITAALGPTWDHDFTPNLSMSLGAAAQLAISPDPNTKPRLGPSGRASFLYSSDASGIGLEGLAGIEPNLLLGTLLQSEQVTLRGFTPISERNRIIFGVSGGYLHAKAVGLGKSTRFDNEFDAVLHDADITWAATDYLSLFLRYQFIGQSAGTGDGATPALVRHGAIFGVDLFASRPPDRQRLPQTNFPKRVDGADGQTLGRPSSGAGGLQRR